MSEWRQLPALSDVVSMNTVVPHDQLQSQTMWAVIEDFVTRDGAIQGHTESPLAEKMQAVQSRLQCGSAVIVFDDAEETFSIVPMDEWLKNRHDCLNECGEENH